MKSEFDITKVVEEIAMQAKETQEEFIFETIQPYCENILQMKINKEELKQILLNGIQKQQPCEDCISREEALKILCDKCPMYDCITGCGSYRAIETMPSVTPQPYKEESEDKE